MGEQSIITTVTGDIPSQTMGMCQFHEHIMVRRGIPADLNPALCADQIEKSRDEVEGFFQAGGRAIVDAQPIGCGRMPAELVRIAEETGVHIVASTGFHLQSFYPREHWLYTASETCLEDLFARSFPTRCMKMRIHRWAVLW